MPDTVMVTTHEPVEVSGQTLDLCVQVEVPTQEAFAPVKSAVEEWEANPPSGADGQSAYQLWLLQPGNEGKSEADFLASLKGGPGTDGTDGDDGEDGASAYDEWRNQPGNSNGSPGDFLASLKGAKGDQGIQGDPGPAGTVTGTARPFERVLVAEGFNDAAVQAAMADILTSVTGGAARKTLVFPPGNFHLTQPLISSAAANTVQIAGLSVRGQGMRATQLYWDNPAADAPADPMANNLITAVRRLRWADIGGFSVISNGVKNRFVYMVGDTSGYNQGWKVEDIEFQGSWDRVFGIDGGATANLNSEMTFRRLFTSTNSVFRDAFFRSGGISGLYNQQNQFLNYWFSDCCLTLTSGTVIRLDKGGNVRVDNGSWSAASASGSITWFLMPNASSNNRGATNLAVRGVKFEPKGDGHKIIDCSWGSGMVQFEGCSDHGSMQNTASLTRNMHRYSGQSWWNQGNGPTVRYTSCSFAGYHQYDGPAQTQGSFIYDGCYVYRGDSGQTSSATDLLRWSSGAPSYRAINCANLADATNR